MMTAMTLSQLVEHTGGVLSGDATFAQLTTDTRRIAAGDCFLALQGEQFDGNQFVGEAERNGAAAAVVSEPLSTTLPTITVADTRRALGLIARCNRRLFTGPLVALTGSSGKTSTKQMLAAILGQCGNVLATRGNLNNEIGVPLTLLEISPEHGFAVIEMGASHRGDIAYLCEFAEPDVALLTNVMPAHIEGFGSLDIIAQTKAEIFEAIGEGCCVINLDDAFSARWLTATSGKRRLTFSLIDATADVFADEITLSDQGTQFCLHARNESIAIQLPLLGRHNVANAIAAAAAALAAGADLAQVSAGLALVTPLEGRLFPIAGAKQILIDDSYNANPGSVKAAIDVLTELSNENCLMLGNMAELGEQSEALHREVGGYARERKIKQLWAVGPMASVVVDAFGAGGRVFTSREEMIEECRSGIYAAAVLVKGSRSAAMEQVVEVLKQRIKMETP